MSTYSLEFANFNPSLLISDCFSPLSTPQQQALLRLGLLTRILPRFHFTLLSSVLGQFAGVDMIEWNRFITQLRLLRCILVQKWSPHNVAEWRKVIVNSRDILFIFGVYLTIDNREVTPKATGRSLPLTSTLEFSAAAARKFRVWMTENYEIKIVPCHYGPVWLFKFPQKCNESDTNMDPIGNK